MSYPDKNRIVEYFCRIFTNFVLSKKFECHVCIYNVLGYKYSQKKSRCIILSLYRRYTPSIIVSCDTAWFDSHIYFWALHYFASLGVQDPVWCQAAITTTYQARHGLWYIANIMIVNIAWGGWQNNRHAGREGFHYGTFGVIFDRHLRGSKYQPDRAKSRTVELQLPQTQIIQVSWQDLRPDQHDSHVLTFLTYNSAYSQAKKCIIMIRGAGSKKNSVYFVQGSDILNNQDDLLLSITQ